MEIGEMVAVALENAQKCPMQHEQPAKITSQPAKGKKDVDVLIANLKAGKSTILFDSEDGKLVDAGLRPLLPKEPSPEDAVVAARGPLPIRIGELNLPVSVAAHHLIPGEDALPKSSIAQYVWAGDVTFSDIGYHVDGAENGVWLPTHGKLAQRMGKAAEIRVPSAGDPNKLVHLSYRFMSRKLEDEGGASFVLAYTQLVMNMFGAQYHDSHKEYSGKVIDMLEAISVWIDKASGDSCQECQKSKSPDGKLPPPHFLAFRLNALSSRLRGYLVGHPTAWKDGFFTSDYARQYKEIEEQFMRSRGSS